MIRKYIINSKFFLSLIYVSFIFFSFLPGNVDDRKSEKLKNLETIAPNISNIYTHDTQSKCSTSYSFKLKLIEKIKKCI